jgi:hypothetical protein
VPESNRLVAALQAAAFPSRPRLVVVGRRRFELPGTNPSLSQPTALQAAEGRATLARAAGFEPAPFGLSTRRLLPLGYARRKWRMVMGSNHRGLAAGIALATRPLTTRATIRRLCIVRCHCMALNLPLGGWRKARDSNLGHFWACAAAFSP